MSSAPNNADSTGQLLRSGPEIARVLAPLAARRETVTAQLDGDGEQFSSLFIHADPALQFILIMTAACQSANAALLARSRVTFVSEPGGWRIEFVAVEPCAVTHEGTQAIRLRYPEILAIQKRLQPRIDVLRRAPLRCIADAGGLTPFDAQIADIGSGGIGMLLGPSDIFLEPGTVLIGCHIAVPGRNPITVDLEVRHSQIVALSDGSRVRRSGCRFVNVSEEVQKLIEELDEQ